MFLRYNTIPNHNRHHCLILPYGFPKPHNSQYKPDQCDNEKARLTPWQTSNWQFRIRQIQARPASEAAPPPGLRQGQWVSSSFQTSSATVSRPPHSTLHCNGMSVEMEALSQKNEWVVGHGSPACPWNLPVDKADVKFRDPPASA